MHELHNRNWNGITDYWRSISLLQFITSRVLSNSSPHCLTCPTPCLSTWSHLACTTTTTSDSRTTKSIHGKRNSLQCDVLKYSLFHGPLFGTTTAVVWTGEYMDRRIRWWMAEQEQVLKYTGRGKEDKSRVT